jgi:hypothetical protein
VPDIEDITSILAKLYALWLLADIIVFLISLIIVWATGSLVDLIASLLMSAALGAIPFPFNILAIWYVDPLSIVAQIVVFVILVAVFQYNSSRE